MGGMSSVLNGKFSLCVINPTVPSGVSLPCAGQASAGQLEHEEKITLGSRLSSFEVSCLLVITLQIFPGVKNY